MNEFNYDDSAYLMHHGVKGMKWGVRKSKDSYRIGKTSNAIKNRISKSTFNRGDEKYIRLDRRHALAANGSAYKSTLKRRAKRMAIGAGIAGGAMLGAAALGAGAARLEPVVREHNRQNNIKKMWGENYVGPGMKTTNTSPTPMTRRQDNQMLKQYRKMGMM